MAEKQPSSRHPTHRQVGQGSPRPPAGRPANHPKGNYCTLVLGLVLEKACFFRLKTKKYSKCLRFAVIKGAHKNDSLFARRHFE